MKESKILLLMIFLKAFLNAINPFVAIYFMGELINGLYLGKNSDYIFKQVCLLSISILLIEVICQFIGFYEKISIQKASYGQSKKLLEKALRLNYQKLESAEIQELLENIKQSKFQRGDVFSKQAEYTETLLTGIFTTISSMVYIGKFVKEKMEYGVNPEQFILLLVCFMVLVIMTISITIYNGTQHNHYVYKRFTDVGPINRRYGFYRKNIFQNFKYGKEIRIFDESNLIQDEFGKISKNINTFFRTVGRQESIFRLINILSNIFMKGLAYIYIGYNSFIHVISVGDVVVYSGAIAQLFAGIIQIIEAITNLKGNEKFLGQYLKFLELSETEQQKGHTINQEWVDIVFEHVYFKHPNGNAWILENVCFHISNREHVAMVGLNGSGKTTCVRLLLRLYRPDSGKILLNGKDIWEYNLDEYWKFMSVVFQDFKLFSFSLKQNLLGNKEENAAIWQVLHEMGMKEKIENMYEGIESCIYKEYDGKGVMISGGEAQKIAVSKALYKNTPMFIMDEPTAALDPLSESQLYEKVNTMMKNKTILYISHRLSSCCFCDKIIVWKDGRIVEMGTHSDLLEENGEYRRLWDAQSEYYRGEVSIPNPC